MFTDRQKEILQLLADGHTYSDIAVLLEISQETVKDHVGRIISKSEANNATHAVYLATLSGVLPFGKNVDAAAVIAENAARIQQTLETIQGKGLSRRG